MTTPEDGTSRPDASVAATALRLLTRRGETLAVAESLTGGLVAAELTSVPGASSAFAGSVTAYATRLKHELLGVDAGLLADRGAVDPDVARSMARGVRDRLGATWGLATTGVAGPAPQDGKPVGTVYVAVAGPSHAAVVPLTLSGDRSAIRVAAVRGALELLVDALSAPEGPPSGEARENGKAKDTEQPGSF
ncbi:CinA family protein [Streptomyces sp. SL13]|uniref:CinA family protein n=1 Tax=Streptantibioticus silvisoli TaxID=2705255 RepID=A0AA90H8B2_9ACTN|nr:CinA family protein [Streptantibioticus silvisoli]MDI5973081.1 CinA family protein [Streptantibioticus silvisoli]